MNLPLATVPPQDGGKPRDGPQRCVPFTEHLGLQVERADGGESVVSVALRSELLDNHDSGHGGVLMTLLDSAMAHAALSRVGYAREVVSVDMHIVFMRPASGRLQANGRATGGGRSVCFCEASITDASGELAARAMGTLRYRDPA